ncbi:hypothetical protein EDB92DRAFT_1836019 [Lactarius akahatsu]|uniref:Uncharacterized protein n=1 Tax=Lactarius akahatsu TaxID=416441 RepID=A0AAD4LMT8_9AGAM|nr:hypothetical protein EDB92DRAFT_1836019 [Lactarius akahatsu]
MYSTKNSHPASSPGPRHVTRPPHYPPELPSPSKRQRLGSTPSSSSSRSLPSTPSRRDHSDSDFFQTRFESAMRLKDAWAQLAQRYARPLDEDDIIDLREEKLLKDCGVVRNLATQINFGDISLPDEPGNDASSDGGGAHSEDEDELDEIDALSHGARVKNRLEARLRRVEPIRELDSEDESDLKDFLEAEKRMREEDPRRVEEEDPPQVEEEVGTEDRYLADELVEISSDEDTKGANADCDSEEDEDELGGWEHDESTAIYEVRTRAPDEHEIIEIFDTPPTSPPSSPLPMSDPPDSRSDTI